MKLSLKFDSKSRRRVVASRYFLGISLIDFSRLAPSPLPLNQRLPAHSFDSQSSVTLASLLPSLRPLFSPCPRLHGPLLSSPLLFPHLRLSLTTPASLQQVPLHPSDYRPQNKAAGSSFQHKMHSFLSSLALMAFALFSFVSANSPVVAQYWAAYGGQAVSDVEWSAGDIAYYFVTTTTSSGFELPEGQSVSEMEEFVKFTKSKGAKPLFSVGGKSSQFPP